MKNILANLAVLMIIVTFANCASSQKIEPTAPVTLKDPYFQKWAAGLEEGGSGFDIYLPVDKSSEVELNTAYFKGKEVSLSYKKEQNSYYGHYTYPKIKKEDIIMSSDPKKEYGNSVPVIERKIPFDLKGNECIIAYTKDGKQGYFKVDNLPEKEMLAYPSQPER